MTGPSLDPDRWALASRLFNALADLPEGEREGALAAATDDAEVRATVARLLAADRSGAARQLDATPGELVAAARGDAEDPSELVGERIGPWLVLREIGRGGMGAVYLAERADGEYRKRVALKVVKRGMDTDEILRRFRRERQILASLEHPNIARLHDGGMTPDGRPYLVMEYVEGERIDRHADAHQLDVDARLALVLTTCRAVAHAHRQRIVHRDIKPSNVMVTPAGEVRLLDFGVARVLDDDSDDRTARTATGRQLLTPAYASPEQLAGGALSPAADVYALGVLLHELLTGRRPPDPLTPSTPRSGGSGSAARLDAPSRVAPSAVRRRLRGDIDAIVARATCPQPEDRYPDAGALASDLELHLAGRRIAAKPPGIGTRLRRTVSAHRNAAAAGAGVVALLAVAVAVMVGRPGAAPVDATAFVPAAIAVVPARAATRDSADAYLSRGLPEVLSLRLGRLRRLRVKSFRSVEAAAAGSADLQALGRELGVSYLVESTVRRRDSLLDVFLGLTEVEEGFQVWADDYTTTPDGLLALQDSMVRDIARAVAGELGEDERRALARRPTASGAAYDHFLRGNFLLATRTPASTADAMRAYEAALSLDGHFAEAMAGAAYAALIFLDWGWAHPDRSPGELLRAAGALSDRAVEIDPSSASVWLSQAYLRVIRDPRRLDGAVEAFERAAALDSLNAETHHQLGQALMVLGRDADALDSYHRALALEPLRPMTLVPVAAIHSNAGRPDSARHWIDSALAVTRTVPAPYALAVWADFALGWNAPAEARAAAESALAMDSSYPVPALAVISMAGRRLGDSVLAAATLARMLAAFDTSAPTPTDARFAAPALAALGRSAEALSLIERARPQGAQLWFYLRSRDFDPLRGQPAFARLMASNDPTTASDPR